MDINFLKQNGVDTDKALELFGDMDIYNETFQDYLDGIDEKLSNLKRSKDNENWQDYGIFAHSIKSDAFLFILSPPEKVLAPELGVLCEFIFFATSFSCCVL